VKTIFGRLEGTGTAYGGSVSGSATARIYLYSTDPLCTITNCSGAGALRPTTTLTSIPLLSGLSLEWPNDHLGWQLQAQTNTLGVGPSTNWVTIPGTANTNSFAMPIDPNNPAVFYRLIYPLPAKTSQ
jgi:hypothetical protein